MRLHLDDDSTNAGLPADVQAILDQIDEADRVADSFGSALSDEQFNWRPDGGRGWSVAQCLEHLASINFVYSDAIWKGIATAQANRWERRGAIAPGFFGRRFVRSLEPPVRIRARTPGSVRPGSQMSRGEILRHYHEAHDQVRQLVRAAALVDANRATFPNPFFRWARVKVSTGLHVIPAHDRRHLWQAEQVTLRPEFPRSVRPGADERQTPV